MPSISSWFSDLSRRKLRLAASAHVGSRDTLNLHRLVLLKNSLTQAELPPPPPRYTQAIDSNSSSVVNNINDSLTTSESVVLSNADSHILQGDAEKKWFDSILESLADDLDDIEVKVSTVEEDIAFLDSDLEDSLHSWVSPFEELTTNDPLPFAFPSDIFLTASVLPSMHPEPSLHLFLHTPNSQHSVYGRPSLMDSRYPEADYDLPLSDASSDAETEDDEDGPFTPYGGSRTSLREQAVVNPEVYVEGDSYFLHGSEIDLFSPPSYIQQC
ncbi:hypothetical protein Clacol_006441 [Clathrus columnatus]|uniref:Uncharacterized protein n=1 Tax=Clathrus columnatus TaxID=1419009 RepID=A0AAV5AH31_9AGAM|nr:hypothetical protein Clacol_006441 [Clathrus columnatus]